MDLALIDRAIGFVCRRNYLSGSEAEDFRQSVHGKLMEDDDKVFRGDGMLETYLAIVVQQHLGDWLRQRWGEKLPRPLGREAVAVKLDEMIGFFCRRNHLSGPEAEDFRQSVYVKVMEDDYKIFRKFHGCGTLEAYLLTVVQHHLLDWRNQKWGKWRPSAEAQRLGPVAVKLEELIRQDGLSAAEACEALSTDHDVEVSRAELERTASLLPPRPPRRLVGEEELDERPAPVERPEGRVLESELRPVHEPMVAVLEKVLGELPADDRLVVEMCDLRGRTIAEAARFLGLPQKPLYRRREQSLARLRRGLETEGFSWKQVSETLGISEVRWD